MADRRASTGRRGEEVAAEYLAERGWRLRERNWRCARGEIDIVADDDGTLVLVEVRTRRGGAGGPEPGAKYGMPEESVGPEKQRRLARLGAWYVQATRWPGPWRIDVVAVHLAPDGQASRVTHYPWAVRGR